MCVCIMFVEYQSRKISLGKNFFFKLNTHWIIFKQVLMTPKLEHQTYHIKQKSNEVRHKKRAGAHKHIHLHTHKRIYINTHTNAHTHTHKRTHTNAYTHTHKRTHTHKDERF